MNRKITSLSQKREQRENQKGRGATGAQDKARETEGIANRSSEMKGSVGDQASDGVEGGIG